MKVNNKKFALASVSVALGVFALYKTTMVAADLFAPTWETCMEWSSKTNNMTAFVEETGFHPYEPLLGGGFVCFMTQIIHNLVQIYPVGYITWEMTVLLFLPVSVLMTVEAGRSGVNGPVRYPTLILLLMLLLGFSIVFPAVWVPGYIFGRTRPQGAVSMGRARLSLPLTLPGMILTNLAFILDPNTYAWTLLVGLVGGPILPLTNLLAWNLEPPEDCNETTMKKTTQAIVMSYAVAGVLALVWWVVIVYVAWNHYAVRDGNMWAHLYADLWDQAEPAVGFMVVDFMIFYAGILIYLEYCRPKVAVMETVALTPLLGPGAAVALAMAELEFERGKIKDKGV